MSYCPHCGRGSGPYIPDSPGLVRPPHMDDEDWAEYRFSEAARVELTHVPDPDIYELNDYDQMHEDARAEALAEEEDERS